jgi:antitoxin (DNA-binding transcriptional repressor) of toxin-antitoxin stability system
MSNTNHPEVIPGDTVIVNNSTHSVVRMPAIVSRVKAGGVLDVTVIGASGASLLPLEDIPHALGQTSNGWLSKEEAATEPAPTPALPANFRGAPVSSTPSSNPTTSPTTNPRVGAQGDEPKK